MSDTIPPCLDDDAPVDDLEERLAASLALAGVVLDCPTLVPGDGKVCVALTVTYQTRPQRRDLFLRYVDPEDYDPEHRLASVYAHDALTHSHDRALRIVRGYDDLHRDFALALVTVDGKYLYDESLVDLWETLEHGLDHPPTGDWLLP